MSTGSGVEAATASEASISKKPRKRNRQMKTFADIAKDCIQVVDSKYFCAVDPDSPCQYYQDNYDAGNMVRHFRARHASIAEGKGFMKQDTSEKKIRHVPKRPVAVDRRLFLEACIKLVTLHHLPLSCFAWEGLRLILDPISAAVDVKINRTNIKGHLAHTAEKIRSIIKSEVANKLISLKLDSASRYGRHVLGINVQYEQNDKLVIRTLGMIEIHERQTATFLKEKVLETLRLYGIKLEQLFSVTTDNGSNMIAAVKQLQKLLEHSICSAQLHEEDETAVEREIDIFEAMSAGLGEHICLVRCAVHTLQLAIGDVFRKTDPKMREITEIVKKMRHIKYKAFIDINNASVPPLWSPTRWGGKYKMLSKIVKQESVFHELAIQYPELCFTHEQWKFIQEYVVATKPLYKCTKVMQTQHYPMSQFYLDWLIAIKEVQDNSSNPFSGPLITALNNRLDRLRENMAFKASLYLDPRFNFLNSTVFKNAEEKDTVQKFIAETWERTRSLNSSSVVEQCRPTETVKPSDDTDMFLTQMFGGSLTSTNAAVLSFNQQLKALDTEPRQAHVYDVWNHWIARKSTHPELYAVAMAVLSVPSNQVSVERAFSALAIVLSHLRTGLSEESLSNILITKLNADLLDKVLPDLYVWKDSIPDVDN